MAMYRPSLQKYLYDELDEVRLRLVRRRWAGLVSLAWLVQLLVTGLWFGRIPAETRWPTLVAWIVGSAVLALTVAGVLRWWSRRCFRSPWTLARALEHRFPSLEQRLFASLEANSTPHSPSFLEDEVTRQVLVHARRHRWTRLVPAWQLGLAQLVPALVLLTLVAGTYAVVQSPRRSQPELAADSTAPTPQATSSDQWQVTPGSTEVEKGSDLLVTVQLPAQSPDPLELVLTKASGEAVRLPMRQSLADPLYVTKIPRIDEPLQYRVEATSSGMATPDFTVDVFQQPELVDFQVVLDYPEFTGLASKELLDPRRIQAVEGTMLTFQATFNQPLARAIWRHGDRIIEWEPSPEDPTRWTATWQLLDSERFELLMQGSGGREAVLDEPLRLTALPNRPAEVRWLQPQRDPQVSPLEELDLQGESQDDFGLVNFGVAYQLAGQPPKEIPLHSNESVEIQAALSWQLALEELAVEPGQLIQVYLWAEDRVLGNDVRRSLSDLLVAEVRDFEQIFRQATDAAGQNPPSQPMGGGPPGSEAGGLVERQKQLLLATWNLMRRSPNETSWLQDAEFVLQQQTGLVEEIRELMQAATSQTELPWSPEEILEFESAMVRAVQGLLETTQTQSVDRLSETTAAQQTILQGLLQLQENEFQVQQSGSAGSPSSQRQAGAPSQQQLQQLQLDPNQNRYEQESTAQQLQDPEQQQAREQLDRLRELARRQEDLNEALQQALAELEAAEDPEAEEELRERLDRLREEQERLQRDAEDLQEQLARDPNARSEDREQIDQARESAQRSAESLAQEEVGQALAQGRRAEEAFESLRDQFQQRTGGAFAEELNRLNEQLDALDATQQTINQSLTDWNEEPSSPNLRDNPAVDQLAEAMETRGTQLDEVMEDLQELIETSESAEPVLSEKLYDAFRQAKIDRVEELADESQEWTSRGLPEQSADLERTLAPRLSELRDAVARSSAFAGNNPSQSLRLAEAKLRELSAELEGEPDSAAGDEASPSGAANASNPDNSPAGERSPEDANQASGSQDGQESGQGTEPDANSPGEGQANSDSERGGESPEDQTGESQAESQGQGNSAGQSDDATPATPSESSSSNSPSSNSSPPSTSAQASGGEGSDSSAPSSGSPPSAADGRTPASSNDNSAPRGAPGNSGDPNGRGGSDPNGRTADQLLDRWSQWSGNPTNPLVGDEYRDWSEQLRDVEDLVPAGPLREEATRIRQRADEMRRDLTRHSVAPDPGAVDRLLIQPLRRLAQEVALERARLEGKDPAVRLDQDPVPGEFEAEVREYFQRLGAGQP